MNTARITAITLIALTAIAIVPATSGAKVEVYKECRPISGQDLPTGAHVCRQSSRGSWQARLVTGEVTSGGDRLHVTELLK
jgi:hypothetical protein